jgi:uncharacterized membrane protein YqhA
LLVSNVIAHPDNFVKKVRVNRNVKKEEVVSIKNAKKLKEKVKKQKLSKMFSVPPPRVEW